MAGNILIGTASWSDPGFVADWYPQGLPAAERLPYYAARFNFVELNSSFYAIPTANVVQRWCEQTPDDFVFDVKLHRLLSRHATSAKFLPPDLRADATFDHDKVVLTPTLEMTVAHRFLDEIRPLKQSGKLGALLLQLSPSFNPLRHQLEELESLLAALKGHSVAVELRHRQWTSDSHLPETLDFFRKHKLTFVSVDAPEVEHFMAMPELDIVTNPKLAYFRFHGRNRRGFISGKTVAERFDYLYNDDELHELASRALPLAKATRETHVVFNNNASDYALRNAASFQKLLAGKGARLPSEHDAPRVGRTLEFDFMPQGSSKSR